MRLSQCRAVVWGALALVLALAAAAPASASPVLELDHGHTRVVQDPFLPPASATDPPAVRRAARAAERTMHAPARAHAAGGRRAGAHVARRRPAARAARARRTVLGQLANLHRAGRLDDATYRGYAASYRNAKRVRGRLSGTRRTELSAVISNLDALAARGLLTLTRLAPQFLTLDRNVEWWTTGKLLHYPDRVTFKGSRLIFQYYPGQGIQLQMLANFGRVNGLFTGGYELNAWQMLDELLPLATYRAGIPVWEYEFWFAGGRPPWVSGMAQAAALQAFARVGTYFDEQPYLRMATRGLRLFQRRPPVGVRVPTKAGAHYLIYSYAPRQFVLNAFIESLIGLYDVAQITGDPLAKRLFAAGDRQARVETRKHDTGAWSLYDLHTESDLHYHGVLQGFLQQLCDRTETRVYCRTAKRFKRDLTTPPKFTLRTRSLRAGHRSTLRFRLSKKSRVGIVVKRGSRVVLSTSGTYAYGVHGIGVTMPPGRGTATVTLTGTDLAGNHGRLSRRVPVR